jgi:uncharacterized protein
VLGFVFRLLPPRPDFPTTMGEEERQMMGAHAGYWREQMAAGRVAAFGPVGGDQPYGIGIIVAEHAAEAERLCAEDPAVRSPFGFRCELSPMVRLVTPEGEFG